VPISNNALNTRVDLGGVVCQVGGIPMGWFYQLITIWTRFLVSKQANTFFFPPLFSNTQLWPSRVHTTLKRYNFLPSFLLYSTFLSSCFFFYLLSANSFFFFFGNLVCGFWLFPKHLRSRRGMNSLCLMLVKMLSIWYCTLENLFKEIKSDSL
jgi:hypothetical protein